MKVRTGLLLASSAALLTMTGCVDQDKSYFDAEKAAAEYAAAFPATDIDPNQDWKTTSNVSLNIAVEEDEGVSYTVRVYTADPIFDSSNAKLLAEGVARKGQPYVSTFDLPNHLEGVYITRTDDHGRTIAHYAGVSNGAITTTFGSVATRFGGESFRSLTKTRSDEVTVPTLTPKLTEAEVLALSATEYNGSVYGVVKIPSGQTVTLDANQPMYGGSSNILIVQGTLKLTNSTSRWAGGAIIYVVNGGKVEFKDRLEIANYSEIVIFEGGTLEGSGALDIETSGGSWDIQKQYNDASYAENYKIHPYMYNAGTIKVGNIKGSQCDFLNDKTGTITTTNGEIDLDGGKDIVINYGTIDANMSQKVVTVYNSGTVKATDYESGLVNLSTGVFTADNVGKNYNKVVTNYGEISVKNIFHGTLTNNGKTTVGVMNTADNNVLVNNCYFYCEGDFRGDITTAANTRTDIGGDLYSGYERNLAENSMIVVEGKANIHSASLVYIGSSTGKALIRANEISDIQFETSTSSIPCNIIIETDLVTDETKDEGYYGAYEFRLRWLSENGGAFAKIGESTFTLAAGDCTGKGNTPNEVGKTKLPSDYQNYVYVFEDNYPAAGDYDFNDLVLDVTSTPYADGNNNIVSYDIDVTLKAVGASMAIGSALRLYGIESSKIGTVTIDDPDGVRNTLSLESSQIGNEIKESGVGNYVVIPLFGDAHQALGVTDYAMTNTGMNKVVPTKTLTLHIATSEKIAAENLDFFITNGKTVGGKRVEVHLFEFLKSAKPATDKGTECPEEASVISDNNYTFAFSAAGFKYPKEYISVADAYPDFAAWAKDRKTKLDWYKNPNTDKDYIYSGQ